MKPDYDSHGFVYRAGQFSEWIKKHLTPDGTIILAVAVGAAVLIAVSIYFTPQGVEVQQAAANRVANQQKTEAMEKVKIAAESFSRISSTNVVLLESAYKLLKEELDAAAKIGNIVEVSNINQAVAEADSMYFRLSEIDSLDADTRSLDIPEKPVYEQPEYDRSYYLSGYYRGAFNEGGIVLRVTARHYGAFGGLKTVRDEEEYVVVENAAPPTVPGQFGYVEDTGRSVTLDIGRSGRFAKIVRSVGVEAFRDDQKTHRDRIGEAKAAYKGSLKEYNEAVKQQKKTDKLMTQIRVDQIKERRTLLTQKPEILASAAVALECVLDESDAHQGSAVEPVGINLRAGQRALMYAAQKGHAEIIRALLKRGVNINARDDSFHGWTALIYAAQKGQIEIIQLLLDKGADVNTKTDNGYTALIWAAAEGHGEAVRVLLDKGADINAKDNDGRTALIGAAWLGPPEVVQLLLDKGADVNVKDNNGYTALKMATKEGNFNIVELLKKVGARM